MGVSSLYKWLTGKFSEIKIKTDKYKDKSVDNLYLDFNVIIHPCCNKSLNNMENTDIELYNNLMELLDDIMDRINPRRLLYIAIDGVAPRTKLNQQRSRRFVSAKKVTEDGKTYFKDDCGGTPTSLRVPNIRAELNDDEELQIFDANAITPGTEFMERLDLFMQELISYKISTDERWKNINVIYSSYRVPGEGEQKILQYIRNIQSSSQNSVILSPDADVIFLGLTLYDYNILILREEPKSASSLEQLGYVPSSKRDYSLVDINKLKKLIIKEFKGLGVLEDKQDYRRFLEDWILLCFSVGNDFLPCSPCFEIRTNALEKLTNILKVVYLRTRSHITNRGKINYSVLREFFKECAKREDQYISEKRRNLVMIRQRMNIPFDDKEEFFIDNERGKIRFYVEKMGIKSEEQLLDSCKEYIKGCEWDYNYYFYDVPSWDWFYPYHYAPFMTDLANVKDISVSFAKSKPLKPMVQLLAVLPPLSKNLLPDCLHPIFDKHKEMYPAEFKEDMFQKCMDWQAIAVLPFVNTVNLEASFESMQSSLSYSECQRNITSYPMMFTRQPKIISKVLPMYNQLIPYENIEIDGTIMKIFPVNHINYLEEEINSHGFIYENMAVKFTFDQRKCSKRSINK